MFYPTRNQNRELQKVFEKYLDDAKMTTNVLK